MSKIHQFADYDQYLETERRGSRYRMNRRPTANKHSVRLIADYLQQHYSSPLSILCHGARDGTEVRLFRGVFPEAKVLGTDVFTKGSPDVIEWDYHRQKPEWVNHWDLIYSNSLDHSPKPEEGLVTWIEQLNPTGSLFLVWTFSHQLNDKPQLPFPGGDCFGATLHEYIDLLRKAGEMKDLLWVGGSLGEVILIAGKKP